MKVTRSLMIIGIVLSLCACNAGGSSGAKSSSNNSGNNTNSSGGNPVDSTEPLTPLAGVSDWTMAGGGPGHTGYVPVTLDPTKFSQRWIVLLPLGVPASDVGNCGGCEAVVYISPAVTDSEDQRVIVTSDFKIGTANADESMVSLLSLNENDGSTAWSVGGIPSNEINDVGNVDNYAAPSIFNGRVYFSYQVYDPEEIRYSENPVAPDPVTTAYDASSGAVDLTFIPTCPGCLVAQPVSSDTALYVGRPLTVFDTSSGNALWTDTTGYDNELTTPAVDGNGVYLSEFDSNSLGPLFTALDPASGSMLYTIDPSPQELAAAAYSMSAPILDGASGALVLHYTRTTGTGFLNHYSLTNHTLDWQVSMSIDVVPSGLVVGNGVVYACNGSSVDAIDDGTGTTLWTWTPATDITMQCSLIVTNNLLFVSGSEATYAVDLKSHATVWSYAAAGGPLSLSPSGLLYITTNGTTSLGQVIAINLH